MVSHARLGWLGDSQRGQKSWGSFKQVVEVMVISICTHSFYSKLIYYMYTVQHVSEINSNQSVTARSCCAEVSMSNVLTPCPAPGVLFCIWPPGLQGQARIKKKTSIPPSGFNRELHTTVQENRSISALVCCCFRPAAITRIRGVTGVQSNSWACG